MLSRQMLQLAERNQWRTNAEEQTIFGEFNGYLFTGLEGKNFKTFITPVGGHPSRSPENAASFYLMKTATALHLRNLKSATIFSVSGNKEGMIPLSADKMEYLLAQISGLLSLWGNADRRLRRLRQTSVQTWPLLWAVLPSCIPNARTANCGISLAPNLPKTTRTTRMTKTTKMTKQRK